MPCDHLGILPDTCVYPRWYFAGLINWKPILVPQPSLHNPKQVSVRQSLLVWKVPCSSIFCHTHLGLIHCWPLECSNHWLCCQTTPGSPCTVPGTMNSPLSKVFIFCMWGSPLPWRSDESHYQINWCWLFPSLSHFLGWRFFALLFVRSMHHFVSISSSKLSLIICDKPQATHQWMLLQARRSPCRRYGCRNQSLDTMICLMYHPLRLISGILPEPLCIFRG